MGSTGSGNFSDYQGFSGTNPKQGGKSEENDCGKAFRTELEDIDNSDFLKSKGILPKIDAQTKIEFNGKRIVAKVDGLEIGNLPTKYNYLRNCLEDFSYSGIITNMSTTPINSITINVTPDA